MPIRVRYQNDPAQECTIRPTPLISITSNVLKNGAGETYGVTYDITLTGTLLPDEGSPYALDSTSTQGGAFDAPYPFRDAGSFGGDNPAPTHVGPYSAFDSNRSHTGIKRPPQQLVPMEDSATAILSKQRALRALFAQDGQRVEITDIREDLPAIICYPRVTNISFSEGTYVLRSDFSINLQADILLHPEADAVRPDLDGTLIPIGSGSVGSEDPRSGKKITEDTLVVALSGAFIENYSESWNIEVDDSQGEVIDIETETIAPRSYRISHSVNATGKTHYMHREGNTPLKVPAWESARKFVTNRLGRDATGAYPNKFPTAGGVEIIGSGTLDLINKYGGYNLVRTENVDEAGGSYSVTENWFIWRGLRSGSEYAFRVSYVLESGRESVLSNYSLSRTWGRDLSQDNLPDDWQLTHFGRDRGVWPGPEVDSDNDGATNVEEFLAGTNPTDPESKLELSIINMEVGQRLTWKAEPGSVYQLQQSGAIGSPTSWINVGRPLVASENVVGLSMETVADIAFYRVVRIR